MNRSLPASKACPVVLRCRDTLQILAFEHPLAGLQLVKGSIEPGESSQQAALRELREEAGISAVSTGSLGQWRCPATGQVWAFHRCTASTELEDHWSHWTQDDGGHAFRFFWQPLAASPSAQWHVQFRQALAFLRARLVPQ